MSKEVKFFRKQADRAERKSRTAPVTEVAENLYNLAKAYRSQADTIKAQRKRAKKRITSGAA